MSVLRDIRHPFIEDTNLSTDSTVDTSRTTDKWRPKKTQSGNQASGMLSKGFLIAAGMMSATSTPHAIVDSATAANFYQVSLLDADSEDTGFPELSSTLSKIELLGLVDEILLDDDEFGDVGIKSSLAEWQEVNVGVVFVDEFMATLHSDDV